MSPRLSRALAAFAVFLLVGPAIGAAVFAVLFTLLLAAADAGVGLLVVYATLAFFPLAYLVGGLQAAFAGAAGFVAASRSYESRDAAVILVATHILSALACWAVLPRGKPADE